MSSALPERKPWSMKWIIAAIILFIAAYTYLTLHYRKPGHVYEPYADMKRRANTGRLLAAGFQRVQLSVRRPADGVPSTNTALPAPGGLPPALKTTIVSVPLLPADVVAVHARDTINRGDTYVIEFRCVSPDDHQQLGDVELYIHGDEVVFAPNFEKLAGGLQSRSRDTFAMVDVPPDTFKPGAYRVTFVGENASRAWRLQVR